MFEPRDPAPPPIHLLVNRKYKLGLGILLLSLYRLFLDGKSKLAVYTLTPSLCRPLLGILLLSLYRLFLDGKSKLAVYTLTPSLCRPLLNRESTLHPGVRMSVLPRTLG
jgi:hypothetical protein